MRPRLYRDSLTWFWKALALSAAIGGAFVLLELDLAPPSLKGLGQELLLLLLALPLLAIASRIRGVRRVPWLLSLRRYRRFGDEHVSVYLSPSAEHKWNGRLLAEVAHEELSGLTHLFGFALWRQAEIIVGDLTAWTDGNGCALLQANTVLMRTESGRSTLRHELVHLFAGRWNWWPPTLFEEGLATYLSQGNMLEEQHSGLFRTLDLDWSELRALLTRKEFHQCAFRHRNYAWAGSFVGFLIQHYGWKLFEKLYRRSHAWNAQAVFKRVYGFSLDEAEWRWKNTLFCLRTLKLA